MLNSKIEEINLLMESMTKYEIRHTFREGNSEADKLANLGANRVVTMDKYS